jgi:hypothetical protein
MNWQTIDGVLDRVKAWADAIVKADGHAMALIGLGAWMCLHGHKEEGQPIIAAGLAVFKGNR